MSSEHTLVIRNGRVVDPVQGWHGEVADLYIANGRISEPFNSAKQQIEAEGRVVTAGGIEPYCHLASPGQLFGRIAPGLPLPSDIGLTYAQMGYVHVHQPCMTLLTAGTVHYGISQIPFVDTSASVAIELRDLGASVRGNRYEEFSGAVRELLRRTKGLDLFLPRPHLRYAQRHYLHKNISSKTLFRFISRMPQQDFLPISLWARPDLLDNAIEDLCLFHLSGLVRCLDTEERVERAVAFLDAGGSADTGLASGHPYVRVDFDSGHSPRDISFDIGMGTPLRVWRSEGSFEDAHARNGWHMLSKWTPKWHLSLSATGMGGCESSRFPLIVGWLLDSRARPRIVESALQGRTFDFSELVCMTRVEPARYLGLTDIGHLKVGARANIAIYDYSVGMDPIAVSQAMSNCWCLIKDGIVVRYEGTFTGKVPPRRLRFRDMAPPAGDVLSNTSFLTYTSLRSEHLACLPYEKESERVGISHVVEEKRTTS